MMKTLGGVLPQGDELTREMFRQSWARGVYPRGIRQQLTAVLATKVVSATPEVIK